MNAVLNGIRPPVACPAPASFDRVVAAHVAAARRIVDGVHEGDRAIARSLTVYHGDTAKTERMSRLLGTFLRAGDLAFDIGAHVGDRIAAFRALGARVVALEPQPAPLGVLRALFADDPGVALVPAVCGADGPDVAFHINSANPTVSTASATFVSAADGAGGWEGQVWDTKVSVPSVSLDSLAQRFGAPRFVKIDVEGYEAEVLAGLSTLPPVLSFEFTTIQRDVAEACLDRLSKLGGTYFNYALGESHELALPQWVSAREMSRFIADLPHEANSGDVYCAERSVIDG